MSCGRKALECKFTHNPHLGKKPERNAFFNSSHCFILITFLLLYNTATLKKPFFLIFIILMFISRNKIYLKNLALVTLYPKHGVFMQSDMYMCV